MKVIAPDPFLVSPAIDFPPGLHLRVAIRMRSTSDALGQLYHGKEFSEERSRAFVVHNDGLWHDYLIPLPPLEPGARIRIDPGHRGGDVGIQWISLESSPENFGEPWARPAELRGKKMIGGGQFTTVGGERAVTSRFLARHPDFTESFPFDGIVVPVVIDSVWAERMGLIVRDYFLHEILWNTVEIPAEAIESSIRDLKSVKWRGVTDNFLNYTLIDGAKGFFTPDLSNDTDWALLERNATLAARLCRDANLKGFWFDTEQYGNYRWRTRPGGQDFDTNRPANLKFPLGKDSPELLQRRGGQWIKAIQREFPEIKILITFAWSPDADGYAPLKGTHGFFNGVLEAIRTPGQLIHGYENTFYYGQGANTTYTQEGFAGDRGRFESAYASMRSWRSYSSNPAKYDSFVKVGMAAWVEDHPWNVWEGFPIGTSASLWSNLALALAYSDEYVWLWSEHTQYGLQSNGSINPFLASLRNRTFNTGLEQVSTLEEDFATDPLRRGWHFDFDMLTIGRKSGPDARAPLMSVDSLPYVWDSSLKALVIQTEQRESQLQGQRRRFVHPIRPVSLDSPFRVSMDFQVAEFPQSPLAPIQLGLTSSSHPLTTQALLLQVMDRNRVGVLSSANGKSELSTLSTRTLLETGRKYRFEITSLGKSGNLHVTLLDLSEPAVLLAQSELTVKGAAANAWLDELGISLSESQPTLVPQSPMGRYCLLKVQFHQ